MSIENILGNKYNGINYIEFVRDLLKDVHPMQKNIDVYSQFQDYISECKFIASFKDNKNKKIAILSVRVANNSRARTLQRNYIAKLLSNGDLQGYDAALVAFYDDIRSNWKLALVTIDFNLTDKGIDVEFQPAKRFSFLVGEGEPSKTYLGQLKPIYDLPIPPDFDAIKDAFSISRVTKDFYNDYCECFEKLSSYLMNCRAFMDESIRLQFDEVKKFAITFTKKTLGQIVFLHFIQKKGWLGVKKNEKWGTGDKDYIYKSTKSYRGGNYFNDVLEPLFYEALNKKRDGDLYNGVKIPFLNGGLFSPVENYKWESTNFDIPDEIWFNSKKTGFIDILNQYNFTVDESDPTEQDIAVDPEMLGKIFESLLDPEERHDNGAHYTPREIVHFMCIESLAYNISDNLRIDFPCVKNYILYGNALEDKELIKINASLIIDYLSKIKIVDPAVGSGAFLVGMLNEILKLRINLSLLLGNTTYSKYEIKKETIQNCLYGVDTEYDAIEIAKLRLWLSLIVDQDIVNDSAPNPLPNLTFHLRVGNSLVETFEGVKIWDDSWIKKAKKYKNQPKQHNYDIFGNKTNKMYYKGSLFDDGDTFDSYFEMIRKTKNAYFNVTNEEEKEVLFKRIKEYQVELIRLKFEKENDYKMLNQLNKTIESKSIPFFIWKLEFEEIFEDGGFDIVIANPPYIQLQINGGKLANELEPQGFKTFTRMGDIYCLFYEQAINLLKEKGTFAFITSNKWMRAGYGEKLRGLLAESTNPLLLIDLGGAKIFESATVDVNILVASKAKNTGQTKSLILDDNCTNNLSVLVEQEKLYDSFTDSTSWTILNHFEKNIRSKITKNSIPLGQSNIKINYGIKTGFNDAFIIDEKTKNKLISLDSKNAEIIRPLIRGRDVKRFKYDNPGLYLLNVHNGVPGQIDPIDIEKYPYVKEFMDKYIDKLKKRQDQGFTPYNLRSCSYLDDFYKRKIIYPETTLHANFYLDEKGMFIDKTCFMMISDYPYYLVSTLSSKLFEYAYKRIFSSIELGKNGYQYNKHALLKLPIVPPNIELEETFKKLNFNYARINEEIYKMYSISDEEISYIESEINA